MAVLPATFIGISIWKQIDGIGTNGIGAAFVATEIITLIAAWIFRKIKHKNSTFYIVPDQNPGINFDFSIKSTMEEAGAVLTEKSWSSARKTVYPETEPILLPCVQKK